MFGLARSAGAATLEHPVVSRCFFYACDILRAIKHDEGGRMEKGWKGTLIAAVLFGLALGSVIGAKV
ncbi:MAG: hypothetical protein ACRD3O_14985, partial [Terriglobia bacterium]